MKFNDILQWTGAVFVIGGHTLNAIGPAVYPYNLVVFAVGTSCFLIWARRVKNHPQMLVNAVSITIGLMGIIHAFG